MNKYISAILFLCSAGILLSGQTADPLVSQCLLNAGPTAKYVKDFRIQLGKATTAGDFRYKATISLWKNTKYRFTMCNSDDSIGQLVLNVRDETNKIILSSFDENSGKIYSYIDFICNRSGIYQLFFDFPDGQPGSGVGLVTMVK